MSLPAGGTTKLVRPGWKAGASLATAVTVSVKVGEGPGVIVGAQGYILTNHHVVGSAGQVKVMPESAVRE